MIRRFVNLVAWNRTRCMYMVHRLDISEHLFYASTAEAEAASDEEKRNGGGDGMPTKIGVLQQLPPASMSFRRESYQRLRNQTFVLLSPSRGSEGRLLHIDKDAGSFTLYDADEHHRSTCTIPSVEGPLGDEPIFITITGKEKENLYLIDDKESSFKVLDLNAHTRKWHPLPPPPFYSCGAMGSFTVLDNGGTICVSLAYANGEKVGTYCFDTRLLKWRQTSGGDWPQLPFQGRVEHVPELDTLVGFGYPGLQLHELCAVSSDPSRTMGAHQAPPTQHAWEYLKTPVDKEKIVLDRRFLRAIINRSTEWEPDDPHPLINLGRGRFCIANVFQETQRVWFGFEEIEECGPKFVVLTGVEVLHGGADAGLRMVKHKSLKYVFTRDVQIRSVL